jgi:predicted dehydrogenase
VSLRIGVAGAGQAGERHAIGFAGCDGAEVVGVADLDLERATAVAAPHGARALTDWRDLLDLDLDVLVVALPHHLHLEPAETAAAAGVHLLMEKPIATTLDEGRRIVEVCERAGVKLTIGFVHRFREEVQAAKRWIDEGALGTPLMAHETMAGRARPDQPGWLQLRSSAGGGVLMYGGIHGIDRLRWLLGSEAVEVTAHTRRFDGEGDVEQGVAALIRFASGAVATLANSAPGYPALPGWGTDLYGSAGQLRIHTRARAELSSEGRSERIDSADLGAQSPHYNFGRQAEAFLAALRGEAPLAVTAADGLATLEIALAIYRSADLGETVTLDPPHR